MKTMLLTLAPLVLGACSTGYTDGNSYPRPNAGAERLEIAARTVECVGVAPQRCLVVNGSYFYDQIKGYTHREGYPAVIYARKIYRQGPVPADASAFIYERVPEPR